MKNIGKYRIFIYFLCLISILFLAFDIFPVVPIRDKSEKGFSAMRVSDDIQCISKQPHSIEHPRERETVRSYLYHRLEQMGGETAVFAYDSIACKFGGHFDIANVYARFDPAEVNQETQYVLLVAHLDSLIF